MRVLALFAALALSACASARDRRNLAPDASECDAPLTVCGTQCVNTQTAAAHCGNCNEPCEGVCEGGQCIVECLAPRVSCPAGCIDPQSDNGNCGALSDCIGENAGVSCQGGDVCQGGVCTCVGDCGDIFEESFTGGEDGTEHCDSWENYIAALGSNYSSVTIYGSEDPTGITCSVPGVVNQIAAGLRDGTEFFLDCDGHTWSMCKRSTIGDELWVDAPELCDLSNCPDPGYIFRICWEGGLWGGVGSPTCSTAGDQTMGLRFE